MHRWKIVPLSEGQRQDVRPEDVLREGHFRACETYRGGGGYDQFPIIAEKRFGRRHHLQFIAQLFGCNLDCPYCYVTREGVWGRPVTYTSEELATLFETFHQSHRLTVFHLMGGAPALQLRFWPELLDALEERCQFDWVFHSDLMLTEQPYDGDVLRAIARPNTLYAVDVKGLTEEEHLANTRKSFDSVRFWMNLGRLEDAGVPYYFTFTNVAPENEARFWERFRLLAPDTIDRRMAEAFSIDLIEYEAQPFVDRVPWGGAKAVHLR